ncbi:MAG: type IV pilus modification PilV family protein [Armatimonadota bacterium]
MKRQWRSNGQSGARGITLLEVIVAMVILSIGIAGTLQAFSACMRTSKAAETYTLAASLAQQAISEMARQPALEAGEYSGTFAEPDEDYSWTADVLQANSDGLLPVRVTVTWGPEAKQSQYELRTYLKSGEASSSPETTEGSAPGGRS